VKTKKIKIIVIGGSAGSIPVIIRILSGIPIRHKTPIIICLHRLKNCSEGMKEVLALHFRGLLLEPNDKDQIDQGCIYLAPANYHLLIDKNERTFSLSTEELINYSRPSIDLTFTSVSNTFKKHTLGIILTGANSDGAIGIEAIYNNGGITIAQDPTECPAPYMPQSAIDLKCVDYILNTNEIISFILNTCS
jgi:two-component system chemotaxis response regulator CheB